MHCPDHKKLAVFPQSNDITISIATTYGPAFYVTFIRRYTRNLVDEGNGRYNLIVLCWDSGQGSGIHDHADSHCFMKVCTFVC